MRILFSHDTIDTVLREERGVTTFSSEAFALDIIALIIAIMAIILAIILAIMAMIIAILAILRE